MIKLISFDFWDTLFKGNPEHSKSRISYISEKYKLDPEFVKKTIKETKKWCDDKGVETLSCIPPNTQLYFLGKNLGLSNFDVVDARLRFFEFLLQYPPICLVDQTNKNKLLESAVQWCVSCNTGFMGELEASWIIDNSPLQGLFNFRLFSEKIGIFKPNPDWVNKISAMSAWLKSNEMIHVGDNDATDGQLCRNTGMHFVKVEPKNPDFSNIFEIIEKEKNG